MLITFPLLGKGQSARLTGLYGRTHADVAGGGGASSTTTTTTTEGGGKGVRYIQLASSSVFAAPGWNDESSPYTPDDPYTPSPPDSPQKGNQRAVAEDELLSLHGDGAVVLALAGLYEGKKGGRDPRGWVRSGRVVRGGGKEGVGGLKGVHFVHGGDVGRGVLGVLMAAGAGVDAREEESGEGEGKKKNKVWGKRWIVTDLRVYDWWDLIMSWADEDGDGDGDCGGGVEVRGEAGGRESGRGGRGKGEGIEGQGEGKEGNSGKEAKEREEGKEGKEGKESKEGKEGTGEGKSRKEAKESEEGNELKHYRKWVMECMRESGVRALPREKEELGRKLDGRGFWEAIGWWPGEGRVG